MYIYWSQNCTYIDHKILHILFAIWKEKNTKPQKHTSSSPSHNIFLSQWYFRQLVAVFRTHKHNLLVFDNIYNQNPRKIAAPACIENIALL